MARSSEVLEFALMSATRTFQSPILVGRDAQLARADQWIADAAAGNGRLVLLAGEPGIGKSRLISSILMKSRAAGFQIAKGDVIPYDDLLLLSPIHDLARTMNDGFGDLPVRLLATDPTRNHLESRPRRLILRDVTEMLLDAVVRPTVYAFDDLQWVDEMTLEVIAELARGAAERPLLIVGAYRRDDLPRGSIHREWRSRLITQRLAEEIRLERLGRDDTALVTTLLLGTGMPAPREVVDAVYLRTNGIPLHIEELLASVGDGSRIDDRAVLAAAVPGSIEDAVLAHSARLSDDAQAVARAGAVIGRCFEPNVLAGVLDRQPAELDEALDELVGAGILMPFQFVEEGYFDFRHQLLRDALYASTPRRDLRRFHARAAEFGETLIAASITHASAHYESAGMPTEAFRAALSAAEAAARVSSWREAFVLFKRAVENMPSDMPDREKARILMGYSDAAGNLDRNDLCTEYARRSRELALRAGDQGRAAEALVNLSLIARREGAAIAERRHLARQLAVETEKLPAGPYEDNLRVWALLLLGSAELDGLHLREARQLLEEATALAETKGLPAAAQNALADIARIDIVEGKVEDGLAALRRIGDASRAIGAEGAAVNSYRDGALSAIRSLDYGQAKIRLGDGMKYADAVEQSFCGHMMASAVALIAWGEGRWDDAVELGGHALSDIGSARTKSIARWALGYTASGRGDRASAEQHLGTAVEFGRRADWVEMILQPQWGLAEAALVAGDPAAAIAQCDDALAFARERGEWALLAPFAVTGVRAYQSAGKPEEAARFLDQLLRAIGPARDIAAPAIDHATGLIKLAEGATGVARESLEKAVAGWDRRARMWEALWARLDLATADLRSNRYGEGMALVRAVRDRAESMGSRPLLARAAELERQAKGRGVELEPWHPLTIREFEVAKKIAEGLTNPQIGEALFVSPKTVSAHVEHILAKLGVSRRTEVAAWVAPISVAHSAVAPSPASRGSSLDGDPVVRVEVRPGAGQRTGSVPPSNN